MHTGVLGMCISNGVINVYFRPQKDIQMKSDDTDIGILMPCEIQLFGQIQEIDHKVRGS